MNYQRRPQVCHPSPTPNPTPTPTPTPTPDTILTDVWWSWMDMMTFVGSTRSSFGPLPAGQTTPGVYHVGMNDDQFNTATLTVEINQPPAVSQLTIVVQVAGFGPLVMSAQLGVWSPTEPWQLGPVSLNFSAPTGNGAGTIKNQSTGPMM